VEIRISLLASGAILLDGHSADLAQLDARLSQAKSPEDRVLVYKQDLSPNGAPQSMEVVKLVIKHKLPVSFSTKADFSDYVDRFGQSHSRSATPAGTPTDKFAPFMPDVDERRAAREVFAEARGAASKTPGGRGVALVGPDRAVMVLPAPPHSAEMDARLPKLPDIQSDRPHNIAVISNTGLFSAAQSKPPEVPHVANAVPFLGYLISFSYFGHRVWIFEGHPSALAAGLEHAEVLLVDSGMLPFLQKDWMAVAQRVMDPPHRVLIFTRERPAIQRAVPDSTPQGWTYGEPDGEASYINCLLTTLAKSGPGATAEIVTAAPLPDLSKLTQDAGELEWIANLPFRYDQLDAGKAIEVLAKNRGASQDEWVVKTVLAAEGEQRKCQFSLRLNADQARKALSIRVI
jgi:hypothetical protein